MGCQCSQPSYDKILNLQENIPEDIKDENNSQNDLKVEQNENKSNKNEFKSQEPEQEVKNEEEQKEDDIKLKQDISKEEFEKKNNINNIQKEKRKKKKYNISNYPQDALEIINSIRKEPWKFAEEVEKEIQNIKEEKGRLIYSGDLKVGLNKGEETFREVIEILKNLQSMQPLSFNEDIKIECPNEEKELKDPKIFMNKIIEKKKKIELNAYFKDAIKDPFIAVLLMVIDDTGKNTGKKREAVLNPNFKYIGISATLINKLFCAYYTFAK